MYSIERHMHIFNPAEHECPVLLAGCGGIGSHVAMQLLALGVEHLTVVDYDRVEGHNLANQIFGQDDVGYYKVDALNEHAAAKLGLHALPSSETFKRLNGRLPDRFIDCPTSAQAIEMGRTPALILAVDSMKARKEIIEEVWEYAILRQQDWHVIDTRMASTHGNIFSFNIRKTPEYLETIVPDGQTEVSPCGTPMVVLPTVQGISSIAVWEYMKLCIDPEAMTERYNIFFKPFMVHPSTL